MPPVSFGSVSRVRRRLGGGVINTAIGFSLFAALGQLIGPKENIENIRLTNDAIKGLEIERNSNLLEIKMGVGATIIVAIGVIVFLGICAKGLIKCFKCNKMKNCIKKNEKRRKKARRDPRIRGHIM